LYVCDVIIDHNITGIIIIMWMYNHVS